LNPDPDDPDDPEIVVKYLHSVVADLGLDPVHAAASVAVLHIPSRRIVRVGDVTVGINGSFDAPVKEVDRIAAQARATLLMSLIQRGCDLDSLCRDDPGRQMILPLLRASSVWHNVEHECLGAGVIDGTHTPRSLIDVFDAPKGAEVILATDGYVNPCHSLEQSESELLKLIQRDPLRISEPPGTKGVLPGNQSFDDRTYTRLNL